MAKQSGLHQIRGKVGEHSYYKQTGVSAGLIRSINQGLSARVKNDEAFANTRLNNQEFGAAANVAGILGLLVIPKFRPMILPFSQAKMARAILELARQNNQYWGQRTVTAADNAQLAAILSSMSKRNANEFVSVSVEHDNGSNFLAKVVYTDTQASLMASLGINDLEVTAAAFNVGTGLYDSAGQMMRTSYKEDLESTSVYSDPVVDSQEGSSEALLNIPTFTPAAGHSAQQFIVFVIMPKREINGTSHVLQEYCSFVALPVPARS